MQLHRLQSPQGGARPCAGAPRLQRRPMKPSWTPMLTHIGAKIRSTKWRPFLHIAAPTGGSSGRLSLRADQRGSGVIRHRRPGVLTGGMVIIGTRGDRPPWRAAADSVRRRQGRRREDFRRREPRHHAREGRSAAWWRRRRSRGAISTPRLGWHARAQHGRVRRRARRRRAQAARGAPIPNLRLIAATRPNLANPQPSHALRVRFVARAAHARYGLRVHRPRRRCRRDGDGLLHVFDTASW